MGEDSSHAKGWWHVRFHIKWPANSEPSWHIDLLIAGEIVAPALQRYRNSIALWRFHRRAVRDAEGHQFSFAFYSSPETAKKIFSVLRVNPLLKRMKRARIITHDLYDDTGIITAPGTEDTSDRNWAPEIRQSWPFFIMGVCQMWMSLIQHLSEGLRKKQKTSSLEKLLALYENTNESIKTLWREQGCHSLLHHLNAMFGYEPVLVREIYLRKF